MSGSQLPFTLLAGESFSGTTQAAIVDTGTLSGTVFTVDSASSAAAQIITVDLVPGVVSTQALDVTSVTVTSIGTTGPVTTQGGYLGPSGSTNLDSLGGLTIANTTTIGITINLSNPVLGFLGITSVPATAYYVGQDAAGNALFEAVGTVPPADVASVGNNGTLVFDLVLSPGTLGSLAGDSFATVAAPVCYAEGTRILMEDGERAIEMLRVGERVVTRAGGARPVRWIGRRCIALDRHPDPLLARPVHFAPDAIAPGVPARPLLVSPDHAVLVPGEAGPDGQAPDALVMARLLVNGASIAQPGDAASVTYYHLELDRHDIVCADGAWAESYIDGGNRNLFDDAPAPALHPDLSPERRMAAGATEGLPLTTDSDTVHAIWQRLAARAGVPPADAAAPVAGTDVALLAGGRLLRPVLRAADRIVFALPRNAARVRLLTSASPPSLRRPWLDDRRPLGLPVRQVSADGRPLPLDGPAFGAGWWAVEHGAAPFRWSAAAATLHVPAETRVLTLWLNRIGTAAPRAAA
jgi:hypothetical protein